MTAGNMVAYYSARLLQRLGAASLSAGGGRARPLRNSESSGYREELHHSAGTGSISKMTPACGL
jgi:hypothetical protein